MPMTSLDITFNEPAPGTANVDHYQKCLDVTRLFLESLGVITNEYPYLLNLQLECPTEHVKNVVQFLTAQHHIGIAKVVSMDSVHHSEIGGEGG